MSFAEQERVLFDLLFDQGVREAFCSDPQQALADYDLEPTEREDFSLVRPDALQLDAFMRIDLILTHLCKSFPVSFSLLSSLEQGIALLRKLVDRQTMQHPPVERTAAFGVRLRETLAGQTFSSTEEKSLLMAILEAELGMAWTDASLKQRVLDSGQAPEAPTGLPDEWQQRPIRLADYVSAAIIPMAYGTLKDALCPCEDSALWRHISQQPLQAAVRSRLLGQQQPRLLVARAVVSRVSPCEPVIDHQTVELSDGFAPLLQHIDGATSVQQILEELRRIGAPESILQGVQGGFQQLLRLGMLELS